MSDQPPDNADLVRRLALSIPETAGCRCYETGAKEACPACVRAVEEMFAELAELGYEVRRIDLIDGYRDREPQPSDGPDYHADHQAWEERQVRLNDGS